jgi:hypothetical protein
VDFKTNEIHVRQRADRYHAIGAPKSESSERSIAFGPFVANTLKKWRLANPHTSWCINRTQDGGLGLPPKAVQHSLVTPP